MTCVVVALADGRAHLFADTAAVGPFGALVRSESKLQVFAEGRFALVVRGAILHGRLIGAAARRCCSYAQARERLPRVLGGALGRLLRLAGAFEVYVAGIDASASPAAFMLVSHRLHEGVEPSTAYDASAISTGPMPDLDPAGDPVAFGIAAAKLQRGVLQHLPLAHRPASIVGGALEHVVVGADGVRSETLGGWCDQLGERLNPMAAFSRSGAKLRKAKTLNLTAWLMPRTPKAMLRNFLAVWAIYAGARLTLMAPGAIYVERTYFGALHSTVETGSGSWAFNYP